MSQATVTTRSGSFIACAVAACATALCAPLAVAVDAGPGEGLEEVVVTAQKREQSLQDVSLSISAFDAETLRDRGITSTAQLGNATPGLVVNDFGNPVITVFTLRGVQQFDFGDHQESPVAVFADGSYVPYLSAVGMNFFDLERVEVLRGPQGTLFGRNATGGVIQLVSARPTEELSGYGQVDAGNYSALRAEGAISGALGGGWLGRLAVLKDQHDGYFKNAIGPDKGDADNTSWRVQLFKPLGNSGELTLAARGSHDETSTSPYEPAAAYPDPVTGALVSGDPAAYASFCANFFGTAVAPDAVDCLSGDANPNDPFRIRHNRAGEFKRDYYAGSATLDWSFANAKLTSITSYGHLKKGYADEDSDGTSLDVLYFGQTADATDVSQELRLAGASDRLSWVAGAYALQIDGDYGGEVGFFGFDPEGLAAVVNNRYSLKTRTGAVFGQGEFTLAPAWTLTAGIRWTEDEKRFHMATPCAGPGCDLIGLTDPSIVQGTGYDNTVPGARTKRSSSNWDGKLQLGWKPVSDLLIYAGVSRGTKAGGYNAGATAFYSVDQVIFDDEELTNYEVGLKRTFANGRARFNASVYDYQYKNIQVFNQNGPSTVTFNRDGRVKGAEAELQARVAQGFDVALGVALLDTKIDPVDNLNILTGELISAEQELPNSPHSTFNARLAKEWLFGSGRFALEGDARYVSKRKLNLIDNPATNEAAYSVFDARASYGAADGHWEIALYGRNLGDEEYRVVGTPFVSTTGSIIEIYGPPRTFGASFRMSF